MLGSLKLTSPSIFNSFLPSIVREVLIPIALSNLGLLHSGIQACGYKRRHHPANLLFRPPTGLPHISPQYQFYRPNSTAFPPDYHLLMIPFTFWSQTSHQGERKSPPMTILELMLSFFKGMTFHCRNQEKDGTKTSENANSQRFVSRLNCQLTTKYLPNRPVARVLSMKDGGFIMCLFASKVRCCFLLMGHLG